MNRDWYKTLTGLMWLALPVTGLNYWLAWDRLPYRMAVHFDANWQPNGYTTREGALELGIGMTAFILIVSTIAALASRAAKPQASWPVLVISYVVLGIVTYANYSILKFNLDSQPARSELAGFPPVTSDSDRTRILPLHS